MASSWMKIVFHPHVVVANKKMQCMPLSLSSASLPISAQTPGTTFRIQTKKSNQYRQQKDGMGILAPLHPESGQ
jgi:hypothetical protein